jgi:hypothetical protein
MFSPDDVKVYGVYYRWRDEPEGAELHWGQIADLSVVQQGLYEHYINLNSKEPDAEEQAWLAFDEDIFFYINSERDGIDIEAYYNPANGEDWYLVA